jgi:DNA-binding transcriptional LysR family regulator
VRPDWELLSSWVAVVEAGSISDAAHALHISQAAVSQRVKRLESVFATPLLDRTTRPARPTPAGWRLFEGSKDLLARANRMVESARTAAVAGNRRAARRPSA